jgi:hypothetical protein
MALEFAHRAPEKAVSLLLKRFPEVQPETARLAYERVLADGIVPKSAVITDEAWRKAISLRTEIGDLRPCGDDFLGLVDNSYANNAVSTCKWE